jgi:hypothetical protein
MSRRALYVAGLAAFIALVAFARWDLVEQAARMSLKQFAKGGAARNKLIFEVVLFGSIILLTLRAIPKRIEPKKDILLLAIAAAAGWLAEAWGTRLGLWKYYTKEAPPLWIVPAWPLGTLVIDRMSDHARRLLEGRLSERTASALYWLLALATAAVFAAFARPALSHPATLALGAALAAAFAVKPNAREALPFLLTGFACVFFADLWGTTNNCWRYYLRSDHYWSRIFLGVGFGMAFDTAVVFLCWRLGNFLAPRLGPEGQRS